jgi:hypothetical protein
MRTQTFPPFRKHMVAQGPAAMGSLMRVRLHVQAEAAPTSAVRGKRARTEAAVAGPVRPDAAVRWQSAVLLMSAVRAAQISATAEDTQAKLSDAVAEAEQLRKELSDAQASNRKLTSLALRFAEQLPAQEH